MSASDVNKRRSVGRGRDSLDNADSIKVVCRFRPPMIPTSVKRQSLGVKSPNKVAIEHNGDGKIDSFKLTEDRGEVEQISELSEAKKFTFDKVFGIDSTQLEVFNEVSGVVKSVMDGFNGTVMAYGQTSAGKSWTMEGSSIWDTENQGIIPRCIDSLFEEINNSNSDIQFNLTISFFEIYCEKVRDLLNPAAFNLKIRETKNDGFHVQDVSEVACTDRESVLRVIELGKTNRASAPTLMNAESSRSHSIVSIQLQQQNVATGRNRVGRLFLVDLAGSEKVSKTGASGMRLEEAKNINSSLTTLGMVINALCDRNSHIPYRDSKLTMILMEALGGNSKTTLIICCNPEQRHTAETMTTLRFGERAKKIKNNAKVNEELSAQELKMMLEKAKKEIVSLKRKLLAAMNGTLPPGMTIDSNLDDEASESAADLSLMSAPSESQLLANNDEILSLNARIVSLEEELEVEKTRYSGELENSLLFRSEVDALKVTIEELEAKLLKTSLEAKSLKSAASSANLTGSPGATAASATSDALPSIAEGEEGAETAAAEEAESISPAEGEAGDKTSEPEDEVEEVEEDPTLTLTREEIEHSRQLAQDMLALNEQSNTLRSTLEGEIKGLERSVSQRMEDARDAQATAQSYAEKYIRLREEYESHVQRLMFKLTQEQQARTHVEDRLEDALHRLWRQSGSTGKSKGFFASFFSAANSMVHHNQNRSELGAHGGHGHHGGAGGNSEREASLTRSLELAEFRGTQLQQELDANKEAQTIVLETKESVMRSLARQNSQLTIERDALSKRSEELAQTVDQLTNLLRSVQSRKMSTPAMTPRGSFIRGGGGMVGGTGPPSARGAGPSSRFNFHTVNAVDVIKEEEDREDSPDVVKSYEEDDLTLDLPSK